MKTKRIITTMALLLVVVAIGIAQNNSSKQPNILILFADDLGWNDISSPIATMGYGSKNHQTPAIDRLAEEGVSFLHAYSQQNCAPSRAALLTGQYAPVNGVYNVGSLARYGKGVKKENTRIIPPKQKEVINPSSITYAETLKKVGYKTYIFGKVHGWHGDLTKDHGFDVDLSCSKKIKNIKKSNYLAVIDADGNWVYDNPLYSKHAHPYTEDYIEKNLLPYANGNDPKLLVGCPKHFTDALTDVVVEELEQVQQDKPFCMWVAYHAIHSDIVGRKDLNEKYKGRQELDKRHPNIQYGALIEQLDQSIARIMNSLEQLGLADNTIVIFTSDNGGVHANHSNEPLRGAKGMFYEGGVRVPLIVKYPGVTKATTTIKEPVHFIDFYPTLAEIAGAKLPDEDQHQLHGESFAGLLSRSKEKLDRDMIFWHFPGYMDVRQEPNTVMTKRVGNDWYKMRYSYEKQTYELYNLSIDLSEQTNLLEAERVKGDIDIIFNKMKNDMYVWLKEMNPEKMHDKNNGEEVKFPLH
jgi:arylsulfatase A-like enzyme